MTGSRKAIIIGWDGATWDYIDPLLAEGRLPNLSRLLPESVRFKLRSTTPPYTNVAWPSLVTGLNPLHTGIYDATSARAGSYEALPTNLTGHRGTPIWKWLNHLGLRCGVLNVPMTFPAGPIDGYMVSGFDSVAQSPQRSYPAGILEEWRQRGAPYTILEEEIALMDSQNPHHERGDLEEFVMRWVTLTRYQGELMGRLWQEWPVDLLFVVFSGTDSINHRTNDREVIGRVYEAADTALGEMLPDVEEETVVCLLSDHGSTPAYRYLSLYRALHDAGWLKFKQQVARRYLQRLPGRLGRALPTIWNILPAFARRLISLPLIRRDPRLVVAYDNIDWQQTRVYARTGMGALYINRQGRRSQGIVPDEAYEPLRDEVITFFEGLRDDRGRCIFSDVRRYEDVYAGAAPPGDDRPDLMLTPASWSDHLITGFHTDPLVRAIPDSSPYGTHTPDGILLLRGPGIRQGLTLQAAEMTDVVPTILAAMDLPVPQNVDGHVLQDAFVDDIQPRWAEALLEDASQVERNGPQPQDSDEISQRLRALGYME